MSFTRGLLGLALVALLVGLGPGECVALAGTVVAAQDEDAPKKSRRQERKDKRGGTRKGAAAGAVVGLALGAVAGEAGAGLAVGATVGAATGMMYDYDQSRQDDRTEMMADAIAGSRQQGAVPGESVGDMGQRKMQDILGDWKLEAWGLDENGERINAVGNVSAVSTRANLVRVTYREISVDGYDEPLGGGYMQLTYDPGQGFFLENYFAVADQKTVFVGEYLADKNAYEFYLKSGDTGALSGGVVHSSVRVVLRIANPSLWFAEAFTQRDGKEVQLQSYRFIRE